MVRKDLAQKDLSLTIAGLSAVLTVASLSPAEAALAALPDRPIARIDQIRDQLRKTLDLKTDDVKGVRLVQWQNWRKF